MQNNEALRAVYMLKIIIPLKNLKAGEIALTLVRKGTVALQQLFLSSRQEPHSNDAGKASDLSRPPSSLQ